jgi:hypothetical protein
MSFEDGPKQHSFDLVASEDTMKELYVGARCIKLASTIVLMNLYTKHGIIHKFADELFALLHLHLHLNLIVW